MIYQDLAQGNLQGAVEKAMGILQCSYHFQQQSSLIDNLVGWALYAMADSTIRDIVINYSLDETELIQLEAQVNRFEKDWERLINRVLVYEKVYSKNLMGRLYEINEKGDVRYTRNPDAFSILSPFAAVWGIGINEEEPSECRQARKSKLQRLFYWMTYNASLDEISAITDDVQAAYGERIVNKKFDYAGPKQWQDIFKYNLTLKSLMELYAETQISVFGKIQKIVSVQAIF